MRRVPLLRAVAQPECVPYDVAANALAHAEIVGRAGARVVVFPELSLTGYELDAPPLTADDPRLAPLVEACRETGSLALAGAPGSSPYLGLPGPASAPSPVRSQTIPGGRRAPSPYAPGAPPAH